MEDLLVLVIDKSLFRSKGLWSLQNDIYFKPVFIAKNVGVLIKKLNDILLQVIMNGFLV